jgi:hypothetical protein
MNMKSLKHDIALLDKRLQCLESAEEEEEEAKELAIFESTQTREMEEEKKEADMSALETTDTSDFPPPPPNRFTLAEGHYPLFYGKHLSDDGKVQQRCTSYFTLEEALTDGAVDISCIVVARDEIESDDEEEKAVVVEEVVEEVSEEVSEEVVEEEKVSEEVAVIVEEVVEEVEEAPEEVEEVAADAYIMPYSRSSLQSKKTNKVRDIAKQFLVDQHSLEEIAMMTKAEMIDLLMNVNK